MITDRISLNLAYIYLTQVEENTGMLIDIELTKYTILHNVTKGIVRFKNLVAFKKYINSNAPLIKFDKLDCQPLNLFELKAFNIVLNNSKKNFIYNDNRIFKTKNPDINNANLDILNKSYMPKFKSIDNEFKKLKLDEYIIQQLTYIDCGYIYTFFSNDYQQLRELFKKYKNI